MTVYKINTNKDGATSVKAFPSKKEAQATGNGGHIVSSKEELADNFALTTGIMRDAFNSLSPEKPVTRFSDRESAVRRLWDKMQMLQAGPAAGGKEPKAPKQPKEKKAKGEPKARKGSRREVPLHIPKGTDNPFRVATASFKAFEIASENGGKTFNELVAMGARANTLALMMRTGLLSTK